MRRSITPGFARSIRLVCPTSTSPTKSRDVEPSGSSKFAPLDYVLSEKADDPDLQRLSDWAGSVSSVAARSRRWRARGFHYVSVQVPGLSAPWYSF